MCILTHVFTQVQWNTFPSLRELTIWKDCGPEEQLVRQWSQDSVNMYKKPSSKSLLD